MVIKITVIHKYKQREVLMKKEKLKVICIYSGEEDAAELLLRLFEQYMNRIIADEGNNSIIEDNCGPFVGG